MLTPRVVHLPTRKKCADFLKAVQKDTKWLWSTGVKPKKLDTWPAYKAKTCIVFHQRMMFGDLPTFRERGFGIMSFDDAMIRIKRMGRKKRLWARRARAAKKKAAAAAKK